MFLIAFYNRFCSTTTTNHEDNKHQQYQEWEKPIKLIFTTQIGYCEGAYACLFIWV